MPDAQHGVLFCTPGQTVGGAERHLAEFLSSLRFSAETDELPLVVACRTAEALDPWVEELRQMDVTVVRLELTGAAGLRSLWQAVKSACVVYLNFSSPIGKYQLAAVIAATTLRRPIVAVHHTAMTLVAHEVKGIQRLAWALILRVYGWLIAQNVAVSEAGRQILIDHYGFPQERVLTIENGVRVRDFFHLEGVDRDAAREAAGRQLSGTPWNSGIHLAMSVGRLSREKGYDILLDAAYRAVQFAPGLRLVIGGDGPARNDLEAQLDLLALHDRVFLLGWLDSTAIRELLAVTDLYIQPSRGESMPLAVLEAMAASSPVLASAVGGLPSLIREGTDGRLFHVGDSQRLAEIWVECISNPAKTAAMGRNGRKRVEEHFDVERTLAALRRVLTANLPG